MFRKLKKKLKKVEEKAKEVAEKELGLERPPARAPAPPKMGMKIELDEDLEKVIRYMLDLMLKGDQTRMAYYFQEDVRSRAVWGAFDAMTEKLGYSYEDFAKYFDANLEALAGEFMAEYQRSKADLEKRGFFFPDLGLEEALIDSLIGVWEGKFWKYDIFSSWDYSLPPDVYMGENQIKISVTGKQAPYEVKVEADFSLGGPPFSMSTRLKGEMTAEGEIKAEGTVDWGTELSLEAKVSAAEAFGLVQESQRETFKAMLRDPRAREEMVRRMEKETGKPREECERQVKMMIEGKPKGAHETPVELTGKVNLRENKMTNGLTGILRPKVPTEEITLSESEAGAIKIKMGNFYFTTYKEKK